MGRIVVNKHIPIYRPLTNGDFENDGQIIVSNEPGFEGIFIRNTSGDVLKIGTINGGAAEVPEYIINFLSNTYLTSAGTVNAINDALSNFNGNVKGDWSEIDPESESYIQNKPKVYTEEEIEGIAAVEVAKIVNGADESFDTLKEIADWISNDTTGAAKMANDIVSLSADSHTHENKDVLDAITSGKVSSWDDAEENAKTYASGLTRALKDYIDEQLRDVAKSSDHVFLSSDEYNTLKENGFVVINDKTIEYSDDIYYCIYEENSEEPHGGNSYVIVNGDIIELTGVTEENGYIVLPNATIDPDGYLEFLSVPSIVVEEDEAIIPSSSVDEDGYISISSDMIDENGYITL